MRNPRPMQVVWFTLLVIVSTFWLLLLHMGGE